MKVVLDIIASLSTAVIAAYTIVLARVTKRQAKLMGDTLKATRDSIELSRKEFLASHRPQLKVRAVERFLVSPNQILNTAVQIANVGAADATITEITSDAARLGIGDKWFPKLDPIKNELPETCVIKCGEQRAFRIKSRNLVDPMALAAAEQDRKYAALRLVGEVVYRDYLGTQRRTGFMFDLDNDDQTWRRHEPADETFQYED